MRIQIEPARVATNFAEFEGNISFRESAQLFARGLPVVEMLQAMAMNAHVLKAFSGFDRIYPNGSLERSLVEKVILRVSQLHDCQFCVNSHLDMMTSLGIETDLPNGAEASRESLAIEYAEHITRDSNRVPDDFFAQLRGVFSDTEIVELTFVVGLITMLNRFNNALGVRYRGELAGLKIG